MGRMKGGAGLDGQLIKRQMIGGQGDGLG